MKCSKCGYSLSETLSEGFDKQCPSCGSRMSQSAIEVLSDPNLGFVKEIRPGQIKYAETVESLFNSPDAHVALIEGGCGIGKSFGYSVPAALRTTKRVIISTGKKTLQDQLSLKDIPYLKEKLGVPLTYAVLKGRSNYLCRRALRNHADLFTKTNKKKLYTQLVNWIDDHEHPGDLNTFPGDTSYPVTECTAEDCSKCSWKTTKCGYQQHKKYAKSASVTVVNHALLGFDLRIGLGRVLGPYDYLIIDEAHTAAEFIRNAFSDRITQSLLKNIFRKLDRADVPVDEFATKEASAISVWSTLFDNLPDSSVTLQAGFLGPQAAAATSMLSELRNDITAYVLQKWETYSDKKAREIVDTDPTKAKDILAGIREGYGISEDTKPGMPFAKKAPKAPEALKGFEGDTSVFDSELYVQFLQVDKALANISSAQQFIRDTEVEDSDNWITTAEKSKRGHIALVRQPVCLAPLVSKPLSRVPKVIFTSATLNPQLLKPEFNVHPQPEYELSVPSPFPYNRSLVYIPKHLPHYKHPSFTDKVADEIVKLTRASQGNALVLFTSVKMLEEVVGSIHNNYDYEFPLFAQMNGCTAADAFAQFIRTDNGVLCGLKSFFEGIDVQGDKLRLVIVTKLPFPPYGTAMVSAKKKILGDSYWSHYYFPMMLTDLQQAVGRLIRTKDDRGVIAILDVRTWIAGKEKLDPKKVETPGHPWSGYGKQLIDALPFSNRTTQFSLIERFFNSLLQTQK